MSKFYVCFTTTASHVVEVEAESEDAAAEAAYEDLDFPYFPGGMSGDLGDWEIERIEKED